MNAQEKIRNQVTADTVVLCIKGKLQSLLCGFAGAGLQLQDLRRAELL